MVQRLSKVPNSYIHEEISLAQIWHVTTLLCAAVLYSSHALTSYTKEKSAFSRMDERIEKMKQVAEKGNIDDFYNLIQNDVKYLEYIDEVPFVDTPLHTAASVGNIPVAMEIMRLKPSFARKPNPNGCIPIDLALQNGHSEMVHQLLHVDQDLVRVRGRGNMTPLHHAAKINDRLDLLNKILSICPDSIIDVTAQNETALHIALKNDNIESFKALVGWLTNNWSQNALDYERKILNSKDEKGNTVLHIAVSKNQIQVSSLQYSIMKIQTLIKMNKRK